MCVCPSAHACVSEFLLVRADIVLVCVCETPGGWCRQVCCELSCHRAAGVNWPQVLTEGVRQLLQLHTQLQWNG